MMKNKITSLYQCGTEFRPPSLDASEKGISHIKDRDIEVAKRGVMYMSTKIEVHDDYCINRDNAEIESILSQITALITNAVLRAVYQSEDAA